MKYRNASTIIPKKKSGEATFPESVFWKCKKDVLKNFAKFTGKHLCHNLFFNKVSDLRPATSFKKRLNKVFNKVADPRLTTFIAGLQLYYKGDLAQVFSREFCEIFKNTFFTEHLRATSFDISNSKRFKKKIHSKYLFSSH